MGQRILRLLHDVREKFVPSPAIGDAWDPAATGQAAGDLIYERLATGAPTMIARIGASEMLAMLQHWAVTSPDPKWRVCARYVLGRTPPPWWDDGTLDAMEMYSGFFPATPSTMARFCERMVEDLALVDILGSWLPAERIVAQRTALRAVRVPLADLEPYLHATPWSRVLRHRRVLLVHPFAHLALQQYRRRTALFPDRDVLPEFTLLALPTVVSIAGNQTTFADWFSALDHMSAQIARESFDVAIIGAGAYGLPLAAVVKRLGRQAVHLGGATQILFGIRGTRWDGRPNFQRLFNDAWVRPDAESRPPKWRELENGAYW
jgi:hypothetical protein